MSEELAGLYVSIGADLSGLQSALDETRFLIEDMMAEGGLLGALPAKTAQDMTNLVVGIGNALGGLPGMLESRLRKPIIDVMNAIRATIQQQLQQILSELHAAAAQIGAVATNLGLPSPVNVGEIPGRASGGPVHAGNPYVVGESGPELFVPGSSGQIIPNHALGGDGLAIQGGTFHIHGVQDVASLYDALQKVARRRGV